MSPRKAASETSERAHASPEDEWAARVSAGVAAGSRESLATLYEAKFDFLFQTAKRATRRDESFALDCVQDAMLRVAAKLKRMDGANTLDAWLRRVVLNAALDRVRSERSLATRASAAPNRPGQEVDAVTRDIEDELARLGSDDRSLIGLRFVRGLTLRQLAAHFGLAPKAIDSRIRRVMAQLRSDRASTEERGG
jgi:RNA polymerase sigma-70 factor (ECF subfamily)